MDRTIRNGFLLSSEDRTRIYNTLASGSNDARKKTYEEILGLGIDWDDFRNDFIHKYRAANRVK